MESLKAAYCRDHAHLEQKIPNALQAERHAIGMQSPQIEYMCYAEACVRSRHVVLRWEECKRTSPSFELSQGTVQTHSNGYLDGSWPAHLTDAPMKPSEITTAVESSLK